MRAAEGGLKDNGTFCPSLSRPLSAVPSSLRLQLGGLLLWRAWGGVGAVCLSSQMQGVRTFLKGISKLMTAHRRLFRINWSIRRSDCRLLWKPLLDACGHQFFLSRTVGAGDRAQIHPANVPSSPDSCAASLLRLTLGGVPLTWSADLMAGPPAASPGHGMALRTEGLRVMILFGKSESM